MVRLSNEIVYFNYFYLIIFIFYLMYLYLLIKMSYITYIYKHINYGPYVYNIDNNIIALRTTTFVIIIVHINQFQKKPYIH